MPQSKLLGRLAGSDSRSRAEAGHALAARLAAAGQGVEERDLAEPPVWRALPYDGPFVVGDQIAVTGHDLLRAASAALPVPVAAPTASAAATVTVLSRAGSGSPAATRTGSPADAPPGAAGDCDGWSPEVWAPDGGRVPVDLLLADILAAARELAQAL